MSETDHPRKLGRARDPERRKKLGNLLRRRPGFLKEPEIPSNPENADSQTIEQIRIIQGTQAI